MNLPVSVISRSADGHKVRFITYLLIDSSDEDIAEFPDENRANYVANLINSKG